MPVLANIILCSYCIAANSGSNVILSGFRKTLFLFKYIQGNILIHDFLAEYDPNMTLFEKKNKNEKIKPAK